MNTTPRRSRTLAALLVAAVVGGVITASATTVFAVAGAGVSDDRRQCTQEALCDVPSQFVSTGGRVIAL